jgi:hypothetical protein
MDNVRISGLGDGLPECCLDDLDSGNKASENVKNNLYMSSGAELLDELSGAFNVRARLLVLPGQESYQIREDVLCQQLHLQ